MNGKRQTIWLVSMLSLMVVLSAYYLFTEDSGASIPKDTAGTIQVDSVKGSTDAALPTVGDNGLVVNEVVADGDVVADAGVTDDTSGAATTGDSTTTAVTDESSKDKAGSIDSDKTATETSSKDTTAKDTTAKDTTAKDTTAKDTTAKDTTTKDTTATTEKTPVKDDAAILDEVASQSVSASSMFNNYLYEREQKNLKDQNDLLALINDMDKTPADNAIASEQLRSLEEKESKITGIEEQLQQKYGEAIVKEEAGDSYKVVVLSDKLDVKQAVGIVDLVMKELSVSQDKISVQYISEQ